MNTNYAVILLVTVLLGTAWLTARAIKRGMKTAPVFTGILLGAALALALSKALYVALMSGRVWPRYGWAAFLRMDATEFSFFGGCLGAVLGMMLSAKIYGINQGQFLSLFAPVGAFVIAGLRLGEQYLDMLGAGSYVENEAFAKAPFAVSNEWGEWFWAVFLLEAVAALIVAAVFTLRKKEDFILSLRFERTAFYLCVPQILCESLRTVAMRWGFVRVEQVLCAVVILGLLIYGCLQVPGQGLWKRFWPVFGAVACVGVIVGAEFGLDKSHLPDSFWYGVMIAALIGFGVLENVVTGRRFQSLEARKLY